MKNKIMKIALGAVALTLTLSFSALAATTTGWENTDGTWHYLKNGDYLTNDWAKSGDAYYYLDDNGELTMDKLIDDGTNLYYVGSDGQMVKNQWKYLTTEDDDGEARWYYFQSTGKAARATSENSKTLTVDGKKYAFDENGKMLYGFVNDGEMIDEDGDVLEADYYYGDSSDGSLKYGWIKISDLSNITGYDDYSTLWLYFGTNGKKVTSASKTIDGNKYSFDTNGVMISGWVATASDTKYYSDESDGYLAKNTWIHAIPGADVDATDYSEGTMRWFYANSSGQIYRDTVKKIGSKYYVFDSVGRMVAGLVDLDQDSTTNAKIATKLDLESTSSKDIINGNYGASLRFFSNDEENDGSMSTGTVKIELEDGEYTFGFSSTGVAYHGIKNNKLYNSGMLLAASTDDKYDVFENPVDDKYYVTSNSGAVVSTGKYVKDGDGYYYAVYSGNKIAKISGDDAAKAASYYAKNGNIGSYSATIIKTYN